MGEDVEKAIVIGAYATRSPFPLKRKSLKLGE